MLARMPVRKTSFEYRKPKTTADFDLKRRAAKLERNRKIKCFGPRNAWNEPRA